MKKWLLLVIVAVVVIGLNLFFWWWSERGAESPNFLVSESLNQSTGWTDFVLDGVMQFSVLQKFQREDTESGVYWFSNVNERPGLIFEKFPRKEGVSLDDDVKQTLLGGNVCADWQKKENYNLISGCAYLDTIYSFVYFEKDNILYTLSVDHQTFTIDEFTYFINSLKRL